MFFPLLLLAIANAYTQPLAKKLAIAVQQLEADSQMRHAIVGLSVYDSKTGRPIYEHNAQIGLAPASTQKLFTSCAAFELLGKDYTYATEIDYNYVKGNTALGYLFIRPSGDPSFGSQRFVSTKPDLILTNIITGFQRNAIKTVSMKYQPVDHIDDNIPNGWIWEDIGNYYGAGAHSFNWMENQYDLVLKSGSKMGDTVLIIDVKPPEARDSITGHVVSAEKGSGDNTIVYLPYGDDVTLINGTIPVNETAFTVSAAISYPYKIFSRQVANRLKASAIAAQDLYPGASIAFPSIPDSMMRSVVLLKHVSPSFDTLNYWFLKKSINLYGEAFIKTMAFKKFGFGSTEKGVELLKDFWSQHGIEKSALHICDGSGLSPQNRVTANALVKVLQYAKTRPWFSSFYYALPEYNGMKMKSGSIGGARAYAGYHASGGGNEYSFAIIVNNYDGASSAVVKKMYRLLDNLK